MLRWILILALSWAMPLLAQLAPDGNPNPSKYPSSLVTLNDLLVYRNVTGTSALSTTLSAGIDNSTLTIPVVDESGFQAGLIAVIESERVAICSVSASTITVCTGGRGFQGTTAVAHLISVAVTAKTAAITRISSSITAATLSIPVQDGEVLLADSVITVENERIKICTIAADTLTVCAGGRGFDGSLASAHPALSQVRNFIVAASLNQAWAEIIAIEAALGIGSGNFCGPGTAGSVFFSDGSGCAEDNANLFYDDSNNRLGLLTATPGRGFDFATQGRVTGAAQSGFANTDTAEAGTTTTNVTAVGHGMIVGDFMVNVTRANVTRGVLSVPDPNNFTVAAVTGQTTGDALRLYKKTDQFGTFEIPFADIDDVLLDGLPIGGLWIRVPPDATTRNFEAGILCESFSTTIDKGRCIFVNNNASVSDGIFVANKGGGNGLAIETQDLGTPTTNAFGINLQVNDVTSVGQRIADIAGAAGPELLQLIRLSTVAGNPALKIDLTGNAAHIAQQVVNVGGNAGAVAYRVTASSGNLLYQISAAVAAIEFGDHGAANTPTLDFHSSGNVVDYDSRLVASGGTASVGQGLLSVAAAEFGLPLVAGAAPTINGRMVYDPTSSTLEYGDNGVNRIVVNLDGAQTFTNKTFDANGTGNVLTNIGISEVDETEAFNFSALAGTTWASGVQDMSAAASFEVPNGAAPTTDSFGELAADNDAWAGSRGALQHFDGTANTFVVAALSSDVPTNLQVPKWNTGGTITWEDDVSGGTSVIRLIQFEEGAVVTSGSPSEVAFDNVATIQLPNGADSEINAWFRVPDDCVVANDIFLVLDFAPNAAPGATNNKVRLKTTARVNNTSAGQTAGDTITMANDTNWDDYVGTVNKIAGGTYVVGDLVQMKILRDTAVANNAAVGFNIAKTAWTYTSSQ